MLKFTLKRIGFAVITLFLIITFTFFLIAGAPGDPIATKVGQMPRQARDVIAAHYGLDKPILERYGIYMLNLLQGDFGESIVYTGRSVNQIIANNAPISAAIAVPGLIIQLVIGVLLGIIAGLNREKFSDQVIRVLIVLAICVPSFVFAALLQYLFAFRWRIVPTFGWGKPINALLPILTIALSGIPAYAKYMRSSVITTLNEDYVLTAKAKGMPRARVLRKHVFRNSILPIVTFIGPAVAGVFSGSFIIENVFSVPGLGRYYTQAVSDMDYTMILGLTVFYAIFYVISLIVVDILYGIVDPRIKLAKSEV